MARYLDEPAFRHDYTPRTAVLLINLGTPDAPTAAALRPYLKEFLSDTRVVEIPRAVWWFILNGIILNTRPRKSAAKYATVWMPEGGPLLVHTRHQATALAEALQARGLSDLVVDFAMRYGNPSVESVMQKLRGQGVERILLFPMYPQYAGSSSATALDAAFRTLMKMRNMPEVRTVRHFHDSPAYIAALAENVRSHWARHGRPDKLVMSFHGVPRFTLDKGDPYHCECHKTGRLLAEALELPRDAYEVCFQSRFGRAEWLQPYTTDVLTQLGQAGTRRIDVICPGFVADCLETLEEIAEEGKETFHAAGGGEYHYIPCLNSSPAWISGLAEMVVSQLQGWLPQTRENPALRCERAQKLGAKQ
ncbi:ferrochelatase [Gulbenkiania indica]|uniref:Ferrochelatase n=2 Tax=Gulbenkiania TaxID=397456 RepID=A0A0K6H1K6_9NEIS|nr:ferrochelatase [Gulbenkiania indica]TCW31331.1 ferrochelatase [Gulbenkiania mobilis]CUA84770.1 ferrochelatase [Gulbenkiania indica]